MAGRGSRGEALRRLMESIRPGGEEAQPAPIPAAVAGRGRASLLSRIKAEMASKASASALELVPPEVRSVTGCSIYQPVAPVMSGASPVVAAVVDSPVEEDMKKLEVRSQKAPVVMKGAGGMQFRATANYIRLELEPGKGVFEYEVRFEPQFDARFMRSKILKSLSSIIGETRTFDGVTLYLPFKLKDQITIVKTTSPIDESPVEVRFIFKKRKEMCDSIQFYNILFRRIMEALEMVRLGRSHFNPHAAVSIPQHKLEVWPGLVTAVDEYEGGIQLCCDTSHRVLRQQTVYDLLTDLVARDRADSSTWKEEFMKAVVGTSVLTRYNNRLYRIDNIDFKMSPRTKFNLRDGEITFHEYYRRQYKLEIEDMGQPMLCSKLKKIDKQKQGEEKDQLVCLVPELCWLTGLTDSQRNDFKVMRDLAVHTRITPNQRQYGLKKFISNIHNNEKAKEILSSWGLRLPNETVDLVGRTINPQDITFGRNVVVRGTAQADWSRAATSNYVITAINMERWAVIHVARDRYNMGGFVETLRKCGPQMGIDVASPEIVELNEERTETFLNALRKVVRKPLQIVVVIFPSSRDDRYSAVKKFCCVERAIPSQVINSRTISRPDKLRSVVQKISLQMNCKLGGTLWSVPIPLKNSMVCGIDTYHDASRKAASVVGFVASMNNSHTRYYSRVGIQTRGDELGKHLCTAFAACLHKYNEFNGQFPDKIIIFRDGVGDGQLNVCRDYEVQQLMNCIKSITGELAHYHPQFLMIVVQKRINTRLYQAVGPSVDGELVNPSPGSVMDHTITRRDWFDFFLISQHVRQGTVTPSHYVVVSNTTELQPEHIQKLAYKMTHLYYNWPGTIRVPAPCQYAHRLAYLVGQNLHKLPDENLADKLFYL